MPLSLSLCISCFISPIRRFFHLNRLLCDLFCTGGLPHSQQEGQDQDMVGCGEGLEDWGQIRDNWFGWRIRFERVEPLEGQSDKKATEADTETKESSGRWAPKLRWWGSWQRPYEQTSQPKKSRWAKPKGSRSVGLEESRNAEPIRSRRSCGLLVWHDPSHPSREVLRLPIVVAPFHTLEVVPMSPVATGPILPVVGLRSLVIDRPSLLCLLQSRDIPWKCIVPLLPGYPDQHVIILIWYLVVTMHSSFPSTSH